MRLRVVAVTAALLLLVSCVRSPKPGTAPMRAVDPGDPSPRPVAISLRSRAHDRVAITDGKLTQGKDGTWQVSASVRNKTDKRLTWWEYTIWLYAGERNVGFRQCSGDVGIEPLSAERKALVWYEAPSSVDRADVEFTTLAFE